VPHLVTTQALSGEGIDALWTAILAHDAYLRDSGALAGKRRAAFEHRVRGLVLGALERRVEARVHALPGDRDPYAAAHAVLDAFATVTGR